MKTPTQQRRRMQKGTAVRRVQVYLPESVLRQFLLDARSSLRSESAMAATIIMQHDAKQEATS